jgi:hypothetical protein
MGGPLGRTSRSTFCLVDEDAQGMLGTEGLEPTRESQNTQCTELPFRALLTNGDVRMLSIARRTSSSVGFDWEAGNLGAKRQGN